MSEFRQSELGRLVLEARRRRERLAMGERDEGTMRERKEREEKEKEEREGEERVQREREEREERAKLVREEREERERIEQEERDYVGEAISKISTDIQPLLESTLASLEDDISRFEDSAEKNDVRGMREELENFLRDMELIVSLLKDFRKEALDAFSHTGKGVDVQTIFNNTFTDKKVGEDVRELLDLLHRRSEEVFKIRYDIPGSKEIADLLGEVFEYGQTHFEYESPEIEVEMDVSKDEEMAQQLSENMKRTERRVRFEDIGDPRDDIGMGMGMGIDISRRRRSGIPITVPPPRISPPLPRSASITEAKSIVRDNPEIDRDTMREILVSEGFSTEVIRESLRDKPKAIPEIEDTPGEGFDLSSLNYGDLQGIVDLYGLLPHESISKSDLIVHIQRNIDKTLLRDIVREKFSRVDYRFENIPIIYAE